MPPTATSQPKLGTDPGSLVGQLLNGKYRVLDVIASGGMGRVYRAEQQPLGREVAIKVLHPKLYEDRGGEALSTFKKRFMLEANTLARLHHPNIVTVHDYGVIDGHDEDCFMVMEFLPGRTLHQRIKAGPAPTLLESLTLVEQIARGLRDAHRHGVVHRDLKPSNVMLVPDDEGREVAKIVDFGLAKLIEDAPKITSTGEVLGSPRYMSPEQMTPGAPIDGRTDLYALGVILFELIAGKHPFESEIPMRIVAGHLHRPPPTLTSVTSERLPAALIELTERCLAKIPDGRPDGMDDFLLALRPCTAVIAGRVGSIPPGGPAKPSGAREPSEAEGRDGAHDDPTGERASSGDLANGGRSGDLRLPLDSRSLRIDTDPTPISTRPPGSRGSAQARRAPHALLTTSVVASVAGDRALVVSLRECRRSNEDLPTAPSLATHSPTFALTIDSTPAGAEVFEDETLLGTTPLLLTLENARVRETPRKLVVRLGGYAPYSVVQGASDEPVHLSIPLTPR